MSLVNIYHQSTRNEIIWFIRIPGSLSSYSPNCKTSQLVELLAFFPLGHKEKLPRIPLVGAGVVLVGGLKIDLSLHEADKHGFFIDLPLELRAHGRMELLSISTHSRVLNNNNREPSVTPLPGRSVEAL